MTPDEVDLPRDYQLAGYPTEGPFVEVCREHATGMPLREAVEAVRGYMDDEGVTLRKFHRAVRRDPRLRVLYGKAKAAYLQHEADRLLELVDETPCDDSKDVARLQLRVKTRQWLFTKLLPAYADKPQVAVTSNGPLTVVTGVPRGDDDRLEELMG